MNLHASLKKEDGFSLTELMVVLVIIGILALLAIPKFMNVTTRAKMTEAKTMLQQVHVLQQAYRYQYDLYATSLDAIGFEQNRIITEGGKARYVINIEQADAMGFVATATAVVDFNRNGVFNVWQVDEEGRILERVPD